MIGGIELGGTKCIVAVANSPLEIVERKLITTKDPISTISEINSFFSNFITPEKSRLSCPFFSMSSYMDVAFCPRGVCELEKEDASCDNLKSFNISAAEKPGL